MENKLKNQGVEATVARALGRSYAKQRRMRSLAGIAAVPAILLTLVAIHLILRSSYYLVMATQIGMPWILHWWFARKGPIAVFLSWMWSAIISSILMSVYFTYAALVDRTPITVAACVVGAFLLALITVFSPEPLAKRDRGLTAFVYCFVVAYSYCALFPVNCLLDRSAVTIYRPVVLQKVYGLRSRGLLVEAWSPEQRLSPASLLIRRGAAMVPPSPELFRAVHPGDTICVAQRNGRLGMSWYTAQVCPWNGGHVALGLGGGF